MKMKFEIKRTKAFRKSYKLCEKRGLNMDLLDDVVFQLANGLQLPVKYRDHQLQGKFKEFRECHIEPDWLLIYKFDNDKLVLTLTNTGSHSDLFRNY